MASLIAGSNFQCSRSREPDNALYSCRKRLSTTSTSSKFTMVRPLLRHARSKNSCDACSSRVAQCSGLNPADQTSCRLICKYDKMASDHSLGGAQAPALTISAGPRSGLPTLQSWSWHRAPATSPPETGLPHVPSIGVGILRLIHQLACSG